LAAQPIQGFLFFCRVGDFIWPEVIEISSVRLAAGNAAVKEDIVFVIAKQCFGTNINLNGFGFTIGFLG